jgi:hypothetical protein
MLIAVIGDEELCADLRAGDRDPYGRSVRHASREPAPGAAALSKSQTPGVLVGPPRLSKRWVLDAPMLWQWFE